LHLTLFASAYNASGARIRNDENGTEYYVVGADGVSEAVADVGGSLKLMSIKAGLERIGEYVMQGAYNLGLQYQTVSGRYEASTSITAGPSVTVSGSATFKAGSLVRLQPGFQAVTGTTFHACIGSVPPPAASRFYYLKDHLGSIRSIVNGSGAVDGYHDFYPFGMTMEQRSGSGSADGRYAFTGYEKDVNKGSLHAGQREYTPETGKFDKVDRFDFKYPGLSPYTYAGNNPQVFIDSNGDSISWYFRNKRNEEAFARMRALNPDIDYMLSQLENAKEWYEVNVDWELMQTSVFDEQYQAKEYGKYAGTLWLRFPDDEFSARHGVFHAFQHHILGDRKYREFRRTKRIEAEAHIVNAFANDLGGDPGIMKAAGEWVHNYQRNSNMQESWDRLYRALGSTREYWGLTTPRRNLIPFYLKDVFNKIQKRANQ